MRKIVAFVVSDIPKFKEALLHWARQFEEVVWFEGNGVQDRYGSFDALLAVDALTSILTDTQEAFDGLQEYQHLAQDWIFGYLAYDLKNDIESLGSNNFDGLHFPDLFFFQPKKMIRIIGNQVEFHYLKMVDDEIDSDFALLCQNICKKDEISEEKNIRIKMRIFKDEYYRQVQKMLEHIHRGDIYEANFCQEFYAEDIQVDPIKLFAKLNAVSRAPFATFLKLNDKYLISASPERYLKKIGTKLISQPIKGTAKRFRDPVKDRASKHRLANDPKERAENIMIVDLVRNDLSKSAVKGSVHVVELCKVYTFEQVHQMISTVSAVVEKGKNPVELIRETFPMGSMTGAPKISAMKIIEELEAFRRGLYSGAVGYFEPSGNFDFNVVIRSILYNSSKNYVSYAVGGAITAKAIPDKEYEECLLKAKAMREVLEG
ncbi:anthranilate synthase component I family protein [Maribacter algicola]|uniref:Anthranilate synthase component I family protein n=1 Tax=Meishania litoralis TaxID=3434685 RepID=A0ACC7LLC5_9FLAO